MKKIIFGILVIALINLAGCAQSKVNDSLSFDDLSRVEEEHESRRESRDTEETETEPEEEEVVLNLLESLDGTFFDGAEVSAADFASYDVTMINIWATYCSPCLDEMPELSEIHEAFTAEGNRFQIIGICMDTIDGYGRVNDTKFEYAKEIAAELELSYQNIVPGEGFLGSLAREITAVPTTLFIDHNGDYIGGIVGSMGKADWLEVIDQVFAMNGSEVKE